MVKRYHLTCSDAQAAELELLAKAIYPHETVTAALRLILADAARKVSQSVPSVTRESLVSDSSVTRQSLVSHSSVTDAPKIGIGETGLGPAHAGSLQEEKRREEKRREEKEEKEKKIKQKKEKESKQVQTPDIASNVVMHLNTVAGTRYRTTSRKTRELIASRLKEGYTEDDICRAIDNQWTQWAGTEFERYMRPETLFGRKLEDYQGCQATRPKLTREESNQCKISSAIAPQGGYDDEPF